MNTANSKTKYSNKFVYNFTDKLTINLKYQHPRGMIRLMCLMVLIQLLLFKIILNAL